MAVAQANSGITPVSTVRPSMDAATHGHSKLACRFDVLPAEIISNIFLSIVYSRFPQSRLRFLATLALVCRRFNRIVLNTRALWSIVFVSPTIFPTASTLRQLLLLAGPSPLTVVLDIGAEGRASDLAKFHLLKKLLAIAHQWKSVEATLRHGWLDTFSSLLPASLPQLRILRLSADEQNYKFPRSASYVNLRMLELSGVTVNLGTWPKLPALEMLDIEDSIASLYRLLPSLARSSKLHTIYMKVAHIHEDVREVNMTTWEPSVRFPSLQHICLTQVTESWSIASGFVMVNRLLLSSLVSEINANGGRVRVAPIKLKLLPFECLAVRSRGCFRDVVQSVLPQLPGLMHLSFDASPLGYPLPLLPKPLQNPSMVCPSLKSLTTRHVAPCAIRQVVEARPGALEEVNIAFQDVASKNVSEAWSLKEYEEMEKDVMSLCAAVPLVRLYGVNPYQVLVRIHDAPEDISLEKARLLEGICDFDWVPWYQQSPGPPELIQPRETNSWSVGLWRPTGAS